MNILTRKLDNETHFLNTKSRCENARETVNGILDLIFPLMTDYHHKS